ncbi:hypothetical protein [Candidatus Nitrosocosmicus arcticus]|uniref:Uncharacterized protein n=1 Tax=Candidatus Nitrosocosmicus arcticus TaxID=2035267 RepID=A0A557SRF9_9ARCH|nr:hypothetical protein [Candidatus Nitrosocosmicus arcticus]TVP39194.1 hypothetical protein NARC_180005 [Candidatus Nitrosocosmicus arcticus]
MGKLEDCGESAGANYCTGEKSIPGCPYHAGIGTIEMINLLKNLLMAQKS